MFLKFSKKSILGNPNRDTVKRVAFMICLGMGLIGANAGRAADELPAGQGDASKAPVPTSGQGLEKLPSNLPSQASGPHTSQPAPPSAPEPVPPASGRGEKVQAGQAVDFPVDI